MDRRGIVWLAALGCGCDEIAYRPVDRVLAIPAAMPAGAEQVRICVTDVGERLLGARFSGQMVFTGVPEGLPIDATVDALDAGGAVIAQWTGADVGTYTIGAVIACGGEDEAACESCAATGHLAEPGEPSVVLGISLTGD